MFSRSGICGWSGALVGLWASLGFGGFHSLAQDSLATVVAQRGDGILSLLRKQGFNPYEAYDDFIALNLDNLRDTVHLYAGRIYTLPSLPKDTVTLEDSPVKKKPGSKKAKEFAIFGKQYAKVLPKSERLKETVYYLVSGHGGPDPGAMTTYRGQSIAEDEYAYDITLRLARELLAHDAQVYIIVRDEDDGIRDKRILALDRDEVVYPDKTIPLNQLKRLKQRTAVINDLYAQNKGKYQRLIVTHVDSRSQGQNIDVFFYYHEKSRNGKKLAESIHKTFGEKYKKFQPNRTYTGTFKDGTSLYMVKKTHPAMTFIEVGNIQNEKDQRRILIPDNRQALAKWISEGILLDYEGD
ncbi:MAG: N-acetylmuramoyl-L-alanine amidase [Bacteroidota bacterium]